MGKEEKEEKEEREGETKSSTSHRLAETSTSNALPASSTVLNMLSTTASTTASSVPSTTISEVVNTRNQSALSSILSQAFLYTQQNTLNERTSSSSRGYQGYGQGGQGGPGGMFSGMAGPGMRQRHERHERERQAELERVRTISTKNSNKSKNKEAGDKEKKEIDELECTLIETTEIVSRLASHQELPIQMVARALHILYPPPVLPELKDLEKIKKLEKSLKSITAQLQEASEEEDHETMEYLDEQRSAIQNQIKKEKKKKTQAEQDIKTKKDKAKQNQKNLKNQKEKEKNPKTAQNITIDEFQAMTKLLFQWTSEEDSELTTFLNDKYIETSNAQPPRSRNRPRSQVSLKPLIATLELPLVRTAKIETRYGKLMDKSITDIRTRASIILVFNEQLKKIIPFVDLNVRDNSERIGAKLKIIRHLILMNVKTKLMESALTSTSNRGHHRRTQINLDRYKAQQSKENKQINPDVSKSTFIQTFKQMYNKISWNSLCGTDKVFSVKYVGGFGEQGVDAGGPYRECLTEVVTDLFNVNVLDLFIQSPNTIDERGQTRDRYVPNPQYTSPTNIQMYEFVGVWMGLSFRTKSNLPFQLPSMVWKILVGELLTIQDIEEIDDEIVEQINSTKGETKESITTKTTANGNTATTNNANAKNNAKNNAAGAGAGAAIDSVVLGETEFNERWSTLKFQAKCSDGSVVNLLPGGVDINVTYDRRMEYVDLLLNYRLHEFDQQLQAIKRGFGTIVPLRLMPLFTWQESEVLVCGSPEIDIIELKKNTAIQGYSNTDDTIKFFWIVMEEWGHIERSKFIQFAWGRQRLPRPGTWSRKMLLSKAGKPSDMPVAHTCFFHVELPPYATLEQARKMLGLTIKYGLGSMLFI